MRFSKARTVFKRKFLSEIKFLLIHQKFDRILQREYFAIKKCVVDISGKLAKNFDFLLIPPEKAKFIEV